MSIHVYMYIHIYVYITEMLACEIRCLLEFVIFRWIIEFVRFRWLTEFVHLDDSLSSWVYVTGEFVIFRWIMDFVNLDDSLSSWNWMTQEFVIFWCVCEWFGSGGVWAWTVWGGGGVREVSVNEWERVFVWECVNVSEGVSGSALLRTGSHKGMCVYIYICIHIYDIYIHIERERERER